MSEFVEYLKKAFAEFGPIQTRKMFGRYGIFYEGLMIGLAANDMLYLKADAKSVNVFAHRKLPPLTYKTRTKRVAMPYYLVPEDALEDPSEFMRWANLGVRRRTSEQQRASQERLILDQRAISDTSFKHSGAVQSNV